MDAGTRVAAMRARIAALRRSDTRSADRRPPAADLPVRLPAELEPPEREHRRLTAEALGPWLQGPFSLGGGLVVEGQWACDLRWGAIEPLVGTLEGARALDLAANAGFDAFMLRLRGCREVVACDRHPQYLRQAEFLEGIYQTGVDFRLLGWETLDPEEHGRFDVVHCAELLYQEPHPLRLLVQSRRMVTEGGRLLLGTMTLDVAEPDGSARFVGGTYAGNPFWWWVPDRVALDELLAASGFTVEGNVRLFGGPPGHFPTEFRCLVARATHAPAEALPDAQPPADPGVVTRWPLGHYYSPVPDTRELAAEPRRSQVWPPTPRAALGVDWRADEQVRLCREVFAAQERLRFASAPTDDPTEYHDSNDQYPALDAWGLEAMLRHLRPRRMIEVGSGFSSLVTARVNREHLRGEMAFTCIEPYPREFLVAGVPGITGLRVEQVQDTPPEVFEQLGDGDVLFIDTSHTVKTGGDVALLFNQVLPRLAPGVVVHVHDVFLPGDYPQQWVLDGWGWNETYLVHAFLGFNHAFDVLLGMQFMLLHHRDALAEAFPGLRTELARGGSSLWLRRAAALMDPLDRYPPARSQSRG